MTHNIHTVVAGVGILVAPFSGDRASADAKARRMELELQRALNEGVDINDSETLRKRILAVK